MSAAGAAPPPTTAAVILAAGAGRRYEGRGHKLLERVGNVSVLAHAVAAPVAAGFTEVLVVAGAVDVAAALAPSGLDAAVRVVANPAWRRGMATSLAAGLAVAADLGYDTVVVGLGDMPTVSSADWLAVANAAPGPVVVSAWADGRRSPPVRLRADVWSSLPGEGDEGARAFWSARPELVTEVARDRPGLDVDTLADLDLLRSMGIPRG